jgi:hypothetical protein
MVFVPLLYFTEDSKKYRYLLVEPCSVSSTCLIGLHFFDVKSTEYWIEVIVKHLCKWWVWNLDCHVRGRTLIRDVEEESVYLEIVTVGWRKLYS